MMLPLLTFGENAVGGIDPDPGGSGCGGGTLICNPLQSGATTITDVVNLVLKNVVLPIGAVIVVFMIIYSGFLFVTAQGSEDKIKNAKQTFLYTIIGAAVLLGALVISELIQKTFEAIKVSI